MSTVGRSPDGYKVLIDNGPTKTRQGMFLERVVEVPTWRESNGTGGLPVRVRVLVDRDKFYPWQSTFLAQVWDGQKWNRVASLLGATYKETAMEDVYARLLADAVAIVQGRA